MKTQIAEGLRILITNEPLLKGPTFLNSFLVIWFFTNKKRTDPKNCDTSTDFVHDR